MTNLTLDIETLPADWTDEQKAAHAAASVPGNYSKPDTIAKWIAENADDCHRRTSFDWRYCRILCIGYAIDNEAPGCIYSPTADPMPLLDGLADVFRSIRARNHGGEVRIIGYNVARFDLPRLRLLAAKLRHPALSDLPGERYARNVADTMLMAGGTDPTMNPKLSDLAAYLGLDGKGEGLDGSKVYDAWLAGEHERIARYCAQDVALTRDVFRVLSGAGALVMPEAA